MAKCRHVFRLKAMVLPDQKLACRWFRAKGWKSQIADKIESLEYNVRMVLVI
jgi:hypothetical protein